MKGKILKAKIKVLTMDLGLGGRVYKLSQD